MTYLELVNAVLRRLRETEVASVASTAYSKLIGDFVNDAKRQVEDSYNWNALSETLTADTVHDLFNSVLVGSGQRFRVIDVINDTTNIVMQNATTAQMDKWFLTRPLQKGAPRYYNFNGVNQYGDTQADLFPVPDATYSIRFNIIKPQDPFTEDTESILVPSEPVIFGAVARALAERGEDGGIGSSEMYQLSRSSLGDAIALESGRYIEEQQWISW